MKKIIVLLLVFIFTITNCIADDDLEIYVLTAKEKETVEQVYNVYKDIFEQKGEKYKNNLISGLEGVLEKLSSGSKNYEILLSLINKFKNISEADVGNNYYCSDENNGNENICSDENENVGNNGNENIHSLQENFDDIFRVNISKVKETWMGRQNEVRSQMGLYNFNYSTKLDTTATEWSEIIEEKDEVDHKRDSSDSYYDYTKIENWLKERGVSCTAKNGYTFSESVAWSSYYCAEDSSDCTYEFLDGMKRSFDRYMTEREKSEFSRSHYNAIVSPNFKYLGLGVVIRKNSNTHFEIYLTTHYCTELAE